MHILRKYDGHKGIIIITHGELQYILPKLVQDNIVQKYYIFLWSLEFPLYKSPYIHRYLLTNYRIKECDQHCKAKAIPFTCREFTPNYFKMVTNLQENNKELLDYIKKKNISIDLSTLNINEKFFDFFIISRCISIKNPLDTLAFFCKTNYRVCFIIQNVDTIEYYNKVINLYIKLGSPKNIYIVDNKTLDDDNCICGKGIPYDKLHLFYKTSKIYFHNCAIEGESRTIHEALCCGNIIMSRENMIGGGNDYYNPQNYVLYNYNNIFEKVDEAIKLFDIYQTNNSIYDKQFSYLNEDSSKSRFSKLLHQDPQYRNLNYNVFYNSLDLNDLNINIPSHNNKKPWYSTRLNHGNIKSDNQYKIFKQYI